MADEELSADEVELELDLPPGQVPEEDTPTRRTIKRTALAQGSKIPLGWKPTASKPIPVTRCNYIFKDHHPKGGQQCEQWSLRGSQLCYMHGGRGNLKNVEEYRKAIIESARLRLTESVPQALETLFDLAQNSGADNVRLKAVTEILDRTGIKTADQLEVSLEVSQADPAAVLAERLGKLKDAAEKISSLRKESVATEQLALPPAPDVPDGDEVDIIEAEVVDDTASHGDRDDAA